MEHPPAYPQGPVPEYSTAGVKIKDSKTLDTDRDDDPPGSGGEYAPPPPYTSPVVSPGPPSSDSTGEFALPEAPMAHAEVCLPAAPGDAAPVAPVAAAGAGATPDYDDLAARFAALSK